MLFMVLIGLDSLSELVVRAIGRIPCLRCGLVCNVAMTAKIASREFVLLWPTRISITYGYLRLRILHC